MSDLLPCFSNACALANQGRTPRRYLFPAHKIAWGNIPIEKGRNEKKVGDRSEVSSATSTEKSAAFGGSFKVWMIVPSSSGVSKGTGMNTCSGCWNGALYLVRSGYDYLTLASDSHEIFATDDTVASSGFDQN